MAKKNSLRVGAGERYTIEVNDCGETIEFDLSDISLAVRMNEAYGALLKAQRDLARDRAAARELPDEQEVDSMFSARTLAELEAQKKFYAAGRAALDLFLGDGACRKIFGDANRPTMFEELMEALSPHVEKMGLRMADYGKRIAEKYGKREGGEDVLEA